MTVAALADRPMVVLTIVAGWMISGMLIAELMARRGHERRSLMPLGMVFGPLLGGLALGDVRHRERETRPLVLRRGETHRGSLDVLVGVVDHSLDSPAVAACVAEVEESLGRLTVAEAIDFESAWDPTWDDTKAHASDNLSPLLVSLAGYRPDVVLLPGEPVHAFTEYATGYSYGMLIVVGQPQRRQLRTLRRAAAKGLAVVIAGGPPDQAH